MSKSVHNLKIDSLIDNGQNIDCKVDILTVLVRVKKVLKKLGRQNVSENHLKVVTLKLSGLCEGTHKLHINSQDEYF